MDAALVTGMFNVGFSFNNTLSKDVYKTTDKDFKDVFSKEMKNKKGYLDKEENIKKVEKKDMKKNKENENVKDVKKEDEVKDKEKVDKKTENKKDEEVEDKDKINGLIQKITDINEKVDVNEEIDVKKPEELEKLLDVENIDSVKEELLKLQEELKLQSGEEVLEVGPQSVETEKITLNKYDELENDLEALREKLGAFDEESENKDVNGLIDSQNTAESNFEFESSFSGEEEFTSAKDGKEEKKINITDFRKKEVVSNKGEQFDFNIEDIKATAEENVVENVSDIIQTNTTNMQEQIDVIKQISEKIDINLFEDKSEMIVKLKPDHLGKVTVEIAVENGNITAKFLAESRRVKEILESSMQDLKDHLAKQGMVVQDLSVSVGNEGNNPRFEEKDYKTFKRRQKIEAVNNEIYSAENSYGIDERNLRNYWPDSTVSFSA